MRSSADHLSVRLLAPAGARLVLPELVVASACLASICLSVCLSVCLYLFLCLFLPSPLPLSLVWTRGDDAMLWV